MHACLRAFVCVRVPGYERKRIKMDGGGAAEKE